MSSHVSHHRRAARALVRRKANHVHVLDERFSPTATLAEMTEVQPPSETLVFPPIGHPHHQDPTTSPILPPLLDPIPPTTTTPIVPVPPITTPPNTPITTPTTTSTTLSSPAPVITTSSAVPTTHPSLVTPSSSTTVNLNTVTTHITANHISSAAASPSSTPSPSSGVNTGAVVGGVGAGIAAIAAIGFAVMFFVRRIRKRREDAIDFSPHDFRRSAVLLPDPPTHEDTVARGYNPPPPPPPAPPMMQQHQQPPVSASTAAYNDTYGQGMAAYGTYHQHQEQEQYASQSAFTHSPPSSVTSPYQGGAAASPYGPNPFATSSSLPSPYEQTTVATPQPAGMTRQLTADPHSPPPSLKSAQVPTDDYVDLSRSSVSPFQAAQYAEISRRLKGLPNSPIVEESSGQSPAELYATQQKDLPAVPPRSHSVRPSVSDHETITQARTDSASVQVPISSAVEYTSQAPVPPAPVAHAAASHSVPVSLAALPSPSFVTAATHVHSATPSHDTLCVQTSHLPTLSTDSISHEPLEFPVPPSPALSYSSRYRVDSSPPTLPEITVQERSSVSSYIPKSPMIGTGYISGISEMSGTSGLNNMGLQSLPGSARTDGKFVPTKSPLASSVVVATPIDAHTSVFAAEQDKALHDGSITTPSTSQTAANHQQGTATPAAAAAAATTGSKTEDKRATVYDLEDAYGGF